LVTGGGEEMIDSVDCGPPSKHKLGRRERTRWRSFGAYHRVLGWPELAG
jgi:hypothetical protein